MTSPTTTPLPSASHVQLMDRMYAVQRHIYDLTRKYYLFGRDQLIAQMPLSPTDRVLEVGCGTARNLLLLARKHPQTHFYGLDAAHVMIDTAEQKITRRHLTHRIHLRQGLAENLHAPDFELPSFTRIFFSYSLSMIPIWPAALNAALANLTPGGELWIVDFWDLAGYPKPFQRLLTRWLSLFHVHHRPELLTHLQQLHADNRVSLTPIGRRYAYLARLIKPD